MNLSQRVDKSVRLCYICDGATRKLVMAVQVAVCESTAKILSYLTAGSLLSDPFFIVYN